MLFSFVLSKNPKKRAKSTTLVHLSIPSILFLTTLKIETFPKTGGNGALLETTFINGNVERCVWSLNELVCVFMVMKVCFWIKLTLIHTEHVGMVWLCMWDLLAVYHLL